MTKKPERVQEIFQRAFKDGERLGELLELTEFPQAEPWIEIQQICKRYVAHDKELRELGFTGLNPVEDLLSETPSDIQ